MPSYREQSGGEVFNRRAVNFLISYASAPSVENLSKLLDCLCYAGEVKNATALIKDLPEQLLSAVDSGDVSSLRASIVGGAGEESEQKLLILDNLANAVRAVKNSLK